MTTDRIPYRAPLRYPAMPIRTAGERPRAYRWPSERSRLPTHCHHCGARAVLTDAPTSSFPTTDVSCPYCSRTICELRHDSLSGGR